MRPGSAAGQRGFTYVMLLIAVAVAGAAASIVAPMWATEVRRAKEAELMRVGREYQRAIASYYQATPGSIKQLPSRLEDLLLDDRFATVRRHLRRPYDDPMTGQANWVVVRSSDGRVAGVASRSERTALSRGPLSAGQAGEPVRYSDWRFVYVPEPDSR